MGVLRVKVNGQWVDVATSVVGAEINYTQIINTLSITATTAATAQVIINPNLAIYYDGAPVIIEFFAPSMQPSTGGGQILATLWDNNTDLGIMAQTMGPAGVTGSAQFARRRLSPTPGTHNYHMRAYVSTGSGMVGANTGVPGGYVPAYQRITQA